MNSASGAWSPLLLALLLVAPIGLATSCAKRDGTTVAISTPTRDAWPTGWAPVDVVAAHLARQDELWISGHQGAVGVDPTTGDPTTGGPSPFLSNDQIAAEVGEARWPDAAALANELRARNQERHPVVLSATVPGAEVHECGIVLSANRMLRAEVAQRAADDPHRGRIVFWEPALSADGRQALVRCQFGPAPHGATATYLLERASDGGWSIRWSELAYYA